MFILVALLGAFNFIVYSGNWGGDPEIHIIFARNFLNGNFFEFNPGEITSGETSPIYMVIVAFLSILLEPGLVPFAMKAVSIIALFFGIFLIAKQAKDKWDRLIIASAIMAIPSISFQAWLGMENLLFAVFFGWVFHSIITTALVYPDKTQDQSQKTYRYSCIASVLFFLRPEAIFLLLAGCLVSFLEREFKSFLIYVTVIASLLISLEIIGYLQGAPLHGAGQLRAIVSGNDAYRINILGTEIYLNTKTLYYFIAISPFFISLLFSLIFDRHGRKREINALIVSCLLLSVPWFLHFLNIFPNTHFSRYQLYFLFSSIMVMTYFYSKSSFGKKLKATIQVQILLLSIGIFYWENSFRNVWFDRILNSNNAKQIYHSQTDETQMKFSQTLCESFNQCEKIKKPIAVALQEVQIRLRLDKNFVVYSLDGVVDHVVEKFIDQNNCVDHFDYLHFRKVKILLEFHEFSPKHIDCGITLKNVEENIEKNGVYEHKNIRFHGFTWQGSTRAWLEYI